MHGLALAVGVHAELDGRDDLIADLGMRMGLFAGTDAGKEIGGVRSVSVTLRRLRRNRVNFRLRLRTLALLAAGPGSGYVSGKTCTAFRSITMVPLCP
jgi:hypothetical protein